MLKIDLNFQYIPNYKFIDHARLQILVLLKKDLRRNILLKIKDISMFPIFSTFFVTFSIMCSQNVFETLCC